MTWKQYSIRMDADIFCSSKMWDFSSSVVPPPRLEASRSGTPPPEPRRFKTQRRLPFETAVQIPHTIKQTKTASRPFVCLVGDVGFEPTTSWSQTKRATAAPIPGTTSCYLCLLFL